MNDARIERIVNMVEGRKQRQRLRQLMKREGLGVQVHSIIQHGQDLPYFESDETPDVDTEELREANENE